MVDDFARAAFREREARQVRRRRGFLVHLAIWVAVNLMLFVVWALTGGGHPWFVYPLLGWGIGIVAHGATTLFPGDADEIVLQREERRLGGAPARSDRPPAR